MNIEYRLGTRQDLDVICLLIRQAIDEMEKHEIYQWDDIYPARQDFEDDIEKHTLYLAYIEESLVALYVISNECDGQYSNAKWKYDEKNCINITQVLCLSAFSKSRDS